MMPRSTSPVQVRVGMHTGNVVSGLIGSKLPKFSIFGDTMRTWTHTCVRDYTRNCHELSHTCRLDFMHLISAHVLSLPGLLPEYAWESVGLIPVKGKVCESNNELAIFPSSGFHGSPSDDKAESAFDLSLTQSTSVKAKSKHFIRKKKQL
eukprot:1158998-Pelagomonas_calceolata.AAC.7